MFRIRIAAISVVVLSLVACDSAPETEQQTAMPFILVETPIGDGNVRQSTREAREFIAG